MSEIDRAGRFRRLAEDPGCVELEAEPGAYRSVWQIADFARTP